MTKPKTIPPKLLASSEDFVRGVTDMWRVAGYQDTSEEVIKSTALKVARAMLSTYREEEVS